MSDAHLSGRHRRAVRSGLLGLGLALGLAHVAQAQEPFVERIPNAYRDLTRSQQATTLPLTGDDEGLLLEVGFPFVYFGETYTQVGVTTEGYLTFGTAVNPGNEPIPSDTPPDAVIAPFWDDLDLRPSPGAKVLIERWGVPGSRALTVQWQEVALKADSAARLSFQVVLFEGTNAVHLLYGAMKNGDGTSGTGRASGSSATIGFEAGDGRRGVQVAFEQAGVVIGASGAGTGLGGGTGATGGTNLVGLVNGGWALVTRPALPEGRGLGDLDGDGRVTVLDQSRQVELRSPRYRPGTTLELVAADVAPLDSNGALWGDGLLAVADRDVLSRVIVGRDTLPPYLSELMPGSPAPGQTLTITGSGFDASDAARNVLVLTVAGGGTREVGAATVNPEGSRITLTLPADARRGPAYVRVDRQAGARRTNARTLGVAGVPAILALAPDPAVIGQTVALAGLELPAAPGQVTVTIGGQAATVLAVVDGPVSASGLTRIVTLTVPPSLAPGSHPVQVTVGDATSEPFSHRFGDLPVVVITAPTDDGVILDRFQVQGTVQDADLDHYELAYAPLGREEEADAWTTFDTGTAAVTSGDLGRFDPTMLLNGYYVVRARAVDRQGLATEDTVRVSVQGYMKLGHFTLSFTDLEVPVSGIAIRVVREYDSRRKAVGDFGVGWRLRMVTVDLVEDLDHGVILENPLSDRVEYRFDPVGDNPIVPTYYTVRFVPRATGERSSLECELPEEMEGAQPIVVKDGVGNWFWFPAGTPFDPTTYRVKMVDGTVLRVHDTQDLLQVIKPDGNTITVSPGGILHSSGKSVVFARDAQDRITTVTDPRGNPQTYTYDVRGDLLKHKDPEGWETTFVYRSDHHMTEWRDPRGIRVQKNEYDDAGRLVATIDPSGQRIEFDHDLDARREVVRDRLGRATISEYDALGRVVAVTTPDNLTERLTYNDRNQILTRTDRRGKTWTFTYDAAGNQDSQSDPLGNTIAYTFDGGGRILTITDADDGITTYTYDPQGRLLTSRDPLQKLTTRTYDAQGNLATITDPANRTTTIDHDGFGNVTRRVEPNGRVTLYSSDPNGNTSTVTQVVPVQGGPSARATTTYTYDKNNLLTRVVYPDQQVVEQRWDPVGRLAERRDSAQRVTVYEHDDVGRLVRRRFGDEFVEGREYDPNGQLLAISDRDGRRSCDLDVRGRISAIRFADGSTIETVWDGTGNLVERKDGRGLRWRYEYDDAGRRTKEIDPALAETVIGYDGRGNVTSRRDPDGRTWTFVYDAVGNHVRTELPDGAVERFERDEVGRVMARVDHHGRRTEFGYGPSNGTESVVSPAGPTTLTFDSRGQPLTRSDPNGHVYQFRYDPLTGHELSRTLPSGAESTRAYDRFGYLVALTTFNGQKVELDRDGMGNLVFRALPDGTWERRRYDERNLLQAVEGPAGVRKYTNDTLGRRTKKVEPDGRSLTWEHDGNGNVVGITSPAGVTSQSYDHRDRLVAVESPAGAVTRMEHTPGGVLKKILYPNGVVSTIDVDDRGRTTRVGHVGPGGPIAGFSYAYGGDGHVSRITEDGGRVTEYGYDDVGRITSERVVAATGVTTSTFSYDPAGNRTGRVKARPDGTTETTTYVLDMDDRLLREEIVDTARTPAAYQVVYGYDAAGHTLSRVSPDRQETYAWDAIGRLSSMSVVQGGTTRAFVYGYDQEGRRLETTRDGVTVRHLVDEQRPVSQVLVDTAPDGQVLASYVHGRFPVSMTDASTGQTHYVLLDGLLSGRVITDQAGAVVATVDFDAFGEVTNRTGATHVDPIYAGDRVDPDTRLVYLRSRYMDPRSGRFLSRDSFDGVVVDPPTLNAYAYALQNPVNRIDPPGTYSFDLGCIFAFDLPQALGELEQALNNRRMKHWEGVSLLKTTIANLYDVGLAAFNDLQGMDVARLMREIFPPPSPPEPVPSPARPPVESAVTSLYGAKVYGRMGPDLLLVPGQSPTGATRPPQERLEEDRRVYGPAGPGSTSTATLPQAQGLAADLVREVVTWLQERKAGGDVEDIRVGQYQTDADGDQVGINRPDIQFVLAATHTRVCIVITGRSSVSQQRRILANDPRAIYAEVHESASLTDVQNAMRQDFDVGITAERFVPPPGSATTEVRQVAYRNLAQEPRYNAASAAYGVVLSTGEFTIARTDMTQRGRGLDWKLERVYRSGVIFPDRSDFHLGHNWTLNYDERIIEAPGRETLEFDAHGRLRDRYTLENVNLTTGFLAQPKGIFQALFNQVVSFVHATGERRTVKSYLKRSPDGTVRKYNEDRWLTEIADRNGNTIQLLRDSKNRLVRAIDPVGREFRYEYQTVGSSAGEPHDLLMRVSDSTGRDVKFVYDDALDLVEVVSPENTRERYTYSHGYHTDSLNHNLLTITAANEVASGGGPFLENTYDAKHDTFPTEKRSFSFDRVVAQRLGGSKIVLWADGTEAVIKAGSAVDGGQDIAIVYSGHPFLIGGRDGAPQATEATVTDRRGHSARFVFSASGNPLIVWDETEKRTSYTYNEDGLRTATFEPGGRKIYIGYDEKSPIPSQRGNKLYEAIVPAGWDANPDAPLRTIVTKFRYEPVFNQVHQVTDTRGLEPVYGPPPPGMDARAWPRRLSDYLRYTVTSWYDYQEGNTPPSQAILYDMWNPILSDVEINKGDLNLDEKRNGPKDTDGDLVMTESRHITLDPLSPEAARLGTTEQVGYTRYVVNEFGQTTDVVDPEGNHTETFYGSHGYVERVVKDTGAWFGVERTAVRSPERIETRFEYDAYGNVTKEVDGREVETRKTYDRRNLLRREERAANHQSVTYAVDYDYDPNGNVTEVRREDRGGHDSGQGQFFVTHMTYDLLDNLIEQAVRFKDGTDGWLATRHQYDAGGMRVETTLPKGNRVAFTYDPRRLLTAQTRGEGTADVSTHTFVFNDDRLLVEEVAAEPGRTIRHDYDGFQRRFMTTWATGNKEENTYDEAGNLTKVVRSGVVGDGTPTVVRLSETRFSYDEGDRVVQTTRILFDRPDLPERPPVVTKRVFDRLSRATVEVEADQGTISKRYDGNNRLADAQDALGNVLRYEYDKSDNPVRVHSIEQVGGATETFTTTSVFDPLGRVTRVSDTSGLTVGFAYDSRGLLATRTDARGPVVADPLALVTSAINVTGNATRLHYDKAGRLKSTERELRAGGTSEGAVVRLVTTRVEYDPNSNVIVRLDDKEQATTTDYDALDRPVAVKMADESRWTYSYDRDDLLVTTVDPNGSTVERHYDGEQRLTEVLVTRGSGVEGTTFQSFVYDGLSRATRLTDEVSAVTSTVVTRSYDSLSRQLEESQDGRAVASTYDSDGNRLTCRYPSDRVVSMSYDLVDRLETVGQGGGPPVELVRYTYRGAGRVAERVHSNGTRMSLTDAQGGAGYDASQRVRALRHLGPGGTTLAAWRLAYDRSSNRTEVRREHEGGLADQFVYDSLSRVVESDYDVPTNGPASPLVGRGLIGRDFVLDGVGNRMSEATRRRGAGGATVAHVATYVANSVNAYTSILTETGPEGVAATASTTATLDYDRNGNLTSDATRTYKYDAFNRLVAVITSTTWVDYRYDVSGRRVETVAKPLDGVAAVTTTVFTYDGLRCIAEQTFGGPRGGDLREYVYGGGLDEILLSQVTHATRPTRTYHHHEDVSGSNVVLTNGSGFAVDRVAYDEWGAATFADPTAHSATGNPHLFQGLRFDEETGLYYARARFYDPSTGRFVQRDPAGIWGDATNLGNPYTFAANNPVTMADPLGLMTEVQLSAGYQSAEEELADIHAKREQHTGTFLYKIGWNFADSGLMEGIKREKELTGELSIYRQSVNVAANSWQGKLAYVVATFSMVGDMKAFIDGIDPISGDLLTPEERFLRLASCHPGKLGTVADVVDLLNSVGAFSPYDPQTGEEFDNCFLAGTLVAMADGTKKPIEQVQAGDRVKAGDPLSGEVVDREVVRTFRNVTDTVVDVTWAPLDRVECMAVGQRGRGERHSVGVPRGDNDSGEDAEPPSVAQAQTVRCTPGHPWWVESQRRWVLAGDLRAGDLLRLASGNLGVVLAAEVRETTAATFNLEVDGIHTYYVADEASDEPEDGALVHNKSKKKPKKTATQKRNSPGTASRGQEAPAVPKEKGQNGDKSWWEEFQEAGEAPIPAQVANALRGKPFKNFGEFRKAFWEEVSKHPELTRGMSEANLSLVKQGFAPYVRGQFHSAEFGKLANIDHRRSIATGGGVYSMSNMRLVTPKRHSEITYGP